MDYFTWKCLALEVARSTKQYDVIELLCYLFLVRGCLVHLRGENGSQFTTDGVRRFLKELGADTLFTEPGSPWEKGYVESFNSGMRDEPLEGELFLHIDEMKHIVERWRMDYNHYRPHRVLGYRTPAEVYVASAGRGGSLAPLRQGLRPLPPRVPRRWTRLRNP